MKKNPTILVYRRTHTGDPVMRGIFGCNECMKSVRGWEYEAVIGIGGVSPDPGNENIACKVNWIGIDSIRVNVTGFDNPLVKFKKFRLFDGNGDLIEKCAPKLYRYMFVEGRIPRTGKYFPDDINCELKRVLKKADNSPGSPGEISECKPQKKKACSKTKPTTRCGGC